SYHFPPVGGAGVQRPAKFAQYLPEFGWDVTVLTCANATAPVRDDSLVETLPEGSTRLAVRSYEPASAVSALNPEAMQSEQAAWRRAARKLVLATARTILQPDPQVLWHLPAYRAIRRHLAAVPHHAVLATAPPYSSLLLGARIARHARLPFFADFRDEWEISQDHIETASRGAFSRRVQRRMQGNVLSAADTIVAT